MSDNLPANPLQNFVGQARKNHRPATRGEGDFLRFNGKTGAWSLGQEEAEVTGEEALVASQTMQHGFLRWGELPPAKAFASLAHPEPEAPEPFEGEDENGRPKTYQPQTARQFGGKFVAEDLGQFVFETSSMGGVENVDKLYDAVLVKAEGSPFCFPKVKLTNEWYKRATGKVFKPVFEIVSWHDQDGNPETLGKKIAQDPAPVQDKDDDDDSGEAEEAPPTRRRRRRVA